MAILSTSNVHSTKYDAEYSVIRCVIYAPWGPDLATLGNRDSRSVSQLLAQFVSQLPSLLEQTQNLLMFKLTTKLWYFLYWIKLPGSSHKSCQEFAGLLLKGLPLCKKRKLVQSQLYFAHKFHLQDIYKFLAKDIKYAQNKSSLKTFFSKCLKIKSGCYSDIQRQHPWTIKYTWPHPSIKDQRNEQSVCHGA